MSPSLFKVILDSAKREDTHKLELFKLIFIVMLHGLSVFSVTYVTESLYYHMNYTWLSPFPGIAGKVETSNTKGKYHIF